MSSDNYLDFLCHRTLPKFTFHFQFLPQFSIIFSTCLFIFSNAFARFFHLACECCLVLPHFRSGIYNDDACTSDYVNHAMLLVGYTKNSWILKNWWSENWGDEGYMYLKRGHNRCGIANYAVYALI